MIHSFGDTSTNISFTFTSNLLFSLLNYVSFSSVMSNLLQLQCMIDIFPELLENWKFVRGIEENVFGCSGVVVASNDNNNNGKICLK